MTGLILVRDPYTGKVIHQEQAEGQPFAVAEDPAVLLDTIQQLAADLVRLRRLVLEVASLGIVTDEDRVGPAARGHQWVEMPVALWDRIEEEVARG